MKDKKVPLPHALVAFVYLCKVTPTGGFMRDFQSFEASARDYLKRATSTIVST